MAALRRIFASRLGRALRLQPQVFGEIGGDETATAQGLLIVGFVGLAHGVGVIGRSMSSGWTLSVVWPSIAVAVEIAFWLGLATSMHAGSRLVWGATRGWRGVATALAFAEPPGLLIALGGLLVGREALLLIPILCLRLLAYYRAGRGIWGWSTSRSLTLVAMGVLGGAVSVAAVAAALGLTFRRLGLDSG